MTRRLEVGLLTGADDRSYALGLTLALAREGIHVQYIGSDELDAPELHGNENIQFLNLRGNQDRTASVLAKATRLTRYYLRLVRYALVARPRLFHILWNNKFEFLDRTLLMLYYRLCGRRIVLTTHNVNTAARDGRDTYLNRLSLSIQYRLADHLFVHTNKMKAELQAAFRVPSDKISVIPFGINNTAPRTSITFLDARQRLNLDPSRKVALFFGQIAPYKGVEYLVTAASTIMELDPGFTLVIAGKVKRGAEQYWRELQVRLPASNQVIAHIAHVPDTDIEWYFKAADVLVLPYAEVFQSGVLFLSYSFGLPVVATDVGAMRDDVIEGETGFICRPRDPVSLAEALREYFASDLYQNLAMRRSCIAQLANERYSWARVAAITVSAYERVLGGR